MLLDAQMRIALMPSAYHPSIGGVEELTSKLADELARAGNEVQVWTSRRDGDASPGLETVRGHLVRRSTFPAPRMSVTALAGWGPAAWRELRHWRLAIEEFRPDVLHVQCFSSNGAYATVLSRWLGVPLILTLQGETVMDDHDIYSHSVFLRSALRWGLRQASAVTACSQFVLDDASRRFGLPAEGGEVIFNGVSLQEVTAAPLQLPFQRYVLGLGRVVPNKGFDLLLRAWAQIADRHPDVGLVIAGQGPQVEPLRELADQLGVTDRVQLAGVLGRPEVTWVMQNSELFVMPSRVEPFGIVVLEGWRAGTAVVASSTGGAPEFVRDGVDGLLADPLDLLGLAEALHTLLSDETLRRRIATAGRDRVPEFAWSRIASQYVHVYERAMGGLPCRSDSRGHL